MQPWTSRGAQCVFCLFKGLVGPAERSFSTSSALSRKARKSRSTAGSQVKTHLRLLISPTCKDIRIWLMRLLLLRTNSQRKPLQYPKTPLCVPFRPSSWLLCRNASGVLTPRAT